MKLNIYLESNVLDIHQHFGSNPIEFEESVDISKDYIERTKIMDKFKIKLGAISPSFQYRKSGKLGMIEVNNQVSNYRRTYNHRFPLAFGIVEPLLGVKECIEELNRITFELKLNGVMFHHRFQGVFLNDKRMIPLLDTMKDLNLPVLIHVLAESHMESPMYLEPLVSKYESIDFILLDALSGLVQAEYLINLMKKHNNVFIDTAAMISIGRLIDKVVENVGSERILFGTDLYVSPLIYNVPFSLIEIIESEYLSKKDKENILWKNAYNLFALNVKSF